MGGPEYTVVVVEVEVVAGAAVVVVEAATEVDTITSSFDAHPANSTGVRTTREAPRARITESVSQMTGVCDGR